MLPSVHDRQGVAASLYLVPDAVMMKEEQGGSGAGTPPKARSCSGFWRSYKSSLGVMVETCARRPLLGT